MVEFLADKFKASVFDRTKDGSTLMHIAALNGHPDTAMVFVQEGCTSADAKQEWSSRNPHGSDERSCFSHQHFVGERRECGRRYKRKNDINDLCSCAFYILQENYTALHLAVEAGKSSVVEALLGHGAQVHIKGEKTRGVN